MSEPVGKISIKQWQKFGLALEQFAAKEDWARVALIDQKLRQLLIQVGKPDDEEQRQARMELAKVHRKVLNQLITSKEDLSQKMKQFQTSREGLSAYHQTELSGER
ncbi:hypothetical protein [Ferrimonas aestuarii]|uniref:Flagellar protein FliT n=1 Tax=Ferrimonas aestuarii TaxID=2569539 RepID=A0A4V5NZA6_9GAMM|nr:hypothetical protein [Ferrimonas aestuarii]TKB54592.1 hypothetical protein FCL42_12330 [Ferrimonas aestuarii]